MYKRPDDDVASSTFEPPPTDNRLSLVYTLVEGRERIHVWDREVEIESRLLCTPK